MSSDLDVEGLTILFVQTLVEASDLLPIERESETLNLLCALKSYRLAGKARYAWPSVNEALTEEVNSITDELTDCHVGPQQATLAVQSLVQAACYTVQKLAQSDASLRRIRHFALSYREELERHAAPLPDRDGCRQQDYDRILDRIGDEMGILAPWSPAFNPNELVDLVPIYDQALTKQITIMGDDDPVTLNNRKVLAQVHRSVGDSLPNKIRHYRDLLSESERMLGNDHPNTMKIRDEFAHFLAVLDINDSALTLYKESLASHLRVFNPHHPYVRILRENIASCYWDAEQYDEAVECYQELAAENLRILGPTHPETRYSREQLAGIYELLGRHDQAKALYAEILTDELRHADPNDPSTLAHAYENAGHYDEAIALYQQKLSRQLRALGPNHPTVLDARRELGCAYQSARCYDAAVAEFERLFAGGVNGW